MSRAKEISIAFSVGVLVGLATLSMLKKPSSGSAAKQKSQLENNYVEQALPHSAVPGPQLQNEREGQVVNRTRGEVAGSFEEIGRAHV